MSGRMKVRTTRAGGRTHAQIAVPALSLLAAGLLVSAALLAWCVPSSVRSSVVEANHRA